jgi:predicted NAD/FAD-dependent oxidoreductase
VFKNGKRTEKQDTQSRFVGVPAMNVVCKHLACDLDVQLSTRVEKVEHHEGSIRLSDDQGDLLGEFDRLIVTAPAGQAAELLADFPGLAHSISQIEMQPCWAVMSSFADAVGDDWVGAFIHDSIVTWAAQNSTKPGRPADAEHLLLHASHEWTADNWERDPNEIAEEVLSAFWQSSGIASQRAVHLQAHRWKFAIVNKPGTAGCFFDSERGIAACGDWANGSRVEGAFLSGVAAAGRILGSLECGKNEQASQQRINFPD